MLFSAKPKRFREYFRRTYPLKSPILIPGLLPEMDDYIYLTTWFVGEVLDAYENWNGKDNAPKKIQELIMVLQNEATQHHK